MNERTDLSVKEAWRQRAITSCAAMVAFGLIGCTAADDSDERDTAAGSGGGYPVAVQTLHGPITIDEQPEKIVALSVATADELIALGVDPIAVAADPAALPSDSPWLADQLVETADPTLIMANYELNIEAIAAIEPDLIVAQTFQVDDRAIFDRLNTIAPTVAPDSNAANVDWDTRLRTTAEAIDRADDAEDLIAEIESEFAAVGESVPGVASKTYQWVRVDDDGFGFGNGSMFELFGMVPAENQDNSQTGDPLAKENTAQLDADLLVIWPPTEDLREGLDDDRLFQDLPAVRNGTVYYAELAFANAINSPGPMALRWLKDQLTPTIQAMAEGSA